MTTYTTDDFIDYNFSDRRRCNIAGKRFCMLTALGVVEYSKGGGPLWLLRCDCGTLVTAYHNRLSTSPDRPGKYSCGCYKRPYKEHFDRKARYPVGSFEHKRARLLSVFSGMGCRCYNRADVSYKNYGARGIFICDEWLNDSETFVTWSLANGYATGLHIDRIDNDGPYSPSNCRWVTPAENQRNRRSTVINHQIASDIKARLAEGQTPKEIATALGLERHIVYNIKNNHAWGEKPRNYYREVGMTSHSHVKAAKGDA